jgi:hypothetical protein
MRSNKFNVRFWSAVFILVIGLAMRSYAGICAGAPVALSSFLPLMFVALPYFILAGVALVVRSSAARVALVVSVVLLLGWDIRSFDDWICRSKEAVVGRSIIWMQAMAIAITLAAITGLIDVIAWSIRGSPDKGTGANIQPHGG